jgi:hypothetical protein
MLRAEREIRNPDNQDISRKSPWRREEGAGRLNTIVLAEAGRYVQVSKLLA